MIPIELVARWEGRLRPWLGRLPAALLVRLYSGSRWRFNAALARRPPALQIKPEHLGQTLWGLHFRAPLFNAAGMYKRGEGYRLALRQGAGAYLAGTTTSRPRGGNKKNGVRLPFAPYPASGAASNFLGLPNPGHQAVAARLSRLPRVVGFPIGASLSLSPEPEIGREQRLGELIDGLQAYNQAAVDFLEINESCPNTEQEPGAFADLRQRLEEISERFLAARERPLPVIVKLSCDTLPEQLPSYLDLLLELGYDGVNFGNTSTAYTVHRSAIQPGESGLYDYFISTFGGGISGRPLRHSSLALIQAAAAYLAECSPPREFHLIRTGGVAEADDVRAGEAAGAALTQWFTGYYEAFSQAGHGLYRQLYEQIKMRPDDQSARLGR